VLATAIDDIQAFQLGFRQRGLLAQKAGKTKNGVQRRTQFMTHTGEECALGTIRHLGRLACQHQSYRTLLHLLLQMILVLDQLILGALAFGQVNEGRQKIFLQHDTRNLHYAHFAIFASHMILMRLNILPGLRRKLHCLAPG